MNQLKDLRAVTTCYDQHGNHSMAIVTVATITLSLLYIQSDRP